MLLPLVSVSLIGMLVGLVVGLAVGPPASTGRRLALKVAAAVAGAWAGFLVFGLTGVTVDAVAGTGVWVPALGHVGAVFGAVLAAWGGGRSGRRRGPA